MSWLAAFDCAPVELVDTLVIEVPALASQAPWTSTATAASMIKTTSPKTLPRPGEPLNLSRKKLLALAFFTTFPASIGFLQSKSTCPESSSTK